MTKKELHANFSPNVMELIKNPIYASILDCAREDMPLGIVGDPTSIVRNEGRIQGWIACLAFMKSIGKVKSEETAPAPTQLYADPTATNHKPN